MLETYDPDWLDKHERYSAELRLLEAVYPDTLTSAEEERIDTIRLTLPTLFDARHRTPDEFIRFHLHHVLCDARKLGLAIEMPSLPDDAGIEATRVVVRNICLKLDAAKRRLS